MFKLQIYSSLVSFLILASCTTARLQPIQSETTVFSSFLAGSYASRIKESQFRSDYLTTAFEYSDFEVSLGQKAISSAIIANNLALAHQHAEVINKKDKNQRMKITAFIKTAELKSTGIGVKVHIQSLKDGYWSETYTNKDLEIKIENNILNEARNLRINSKK